MSADEGQVRVRMDDGVVLAGTLSVPVEGAVRGTALLLSGSGPQDRDETIAGVRPFAVLAAALARYGIATGRFDDRGVGDSGGDYLASAPARIVADTVALGEALRRGLGGAADATWAPTLVGHSQGALVALRAALEAPDRFGPVVLLGAGIRPGRTVLMDQHRGFGIEAGIEGEELDAFVAERASLFDVIEAHADPGSRREAVERFLRERTEGLDDDAFHPEFASRDDYVRFATEDACEWEVRDLLLSRPEDLLGRVQAPVLGLWGDRDAHVDAESERAAFDGVAGGGMRRSTVLERRNHLFQVSATGRIEDYAGDGAPMEEHVPFALATWTLGDRGIDDAAPVAADFGIPDDLDAGAARRRLLGCSLEDVQALLDENFLAVQEDFMWMGPRVFAWALPAFVRSLRARADTDEMRMFVGACAYQIAWTPGHRALCACAPAVERTLSWIANEQRTHGVGRAGRIELARIRRAWRRLRGERAELSG